MSCCIQKKKTGLCAEPEGLYCVQWIIQVYKAVPFPDLLKRLTLKTLDSDGVIKKDTVKIIPLLIYYNKLYILYPLINALILDT